MAMKSGTPLHPGYDSHRETMPAMPGYKDGRGKENMRNPSINGKPPAAPVRPDPHRPVYHSGTKARPDSYMPPVHAPPKPAPKTGRITPKGKK